MNKKIILLMLALPLILMLSLFTATSTVSLAIPVPVTRVEVHEKKNEYIYLALNETYEIAYTVYPTNAANQDVVFDAQPIQGATPTAKVKFENNTIIPESCGEVEIFVRTVDGGYEDSFLLSVYSKDLEGIESYVEKTTIAIGETIQIQTEFIPTNTPYAQRALGYTVLNGDTVVKVNDVGKVTAIGVGEATVRVYCKVNEAVYCDVTLTVENAAPIEFQTKSVVNTILENGGEIVLFVDDAATWDHLEITLSDDTALTYELDLDGKRLTYTFIGSEVCEVTITLRVTIGEEVFEDTCQITRVSEITAEWLNGNPNGHIVYKGSVYELYFEVTPSSADVEYSVTFNKDGYFTYDESTLQSGIVKLNPVETAEEDTVVVYLTITDAEGNQITLEQVLILLNA